jgi:PAS domain S-box-containing protein
MTAEKMTFSPITQKIRKPRPMVFFLLFFVLSSLNPDLALANKPGQGGFTDNAGTALSVPLTDSEKAWLSKKHTVRVCATDHAPLMSYKEGKPIGIGADLLNAVTKRTGIKFEIAEPLDNFASSLKGLITHQGPDVIANLNPTRERKKVILFTKPHVSSPKFIFTRDDAPFVSSMASLSGKTVAVVKGYLTHKLLAKDHPDINLLICNNNKEALGAVSSGKAFAFIGSLLATSSMINDLGLSNLKASAPSSLPNAVVAMGIRSDWPELRDIMAKVFDAIPEHEKAAIINKWSTVKVDYGIKPGDVLKWVLGAAGAIFILVLLFVFWNRQLRVKVRERTAALDTEIVERRQSEEALKESEKSLQRLMDQSPISIQVSNPDGSVSHVNPAFMALWGISQDTLQEIYEKYNVLEDEQIRELGVMPLMERAYKGEKMTLPPLQYDALDTFEKLGFENSGEGRKRWIQCRLYPIRDKDGRVVNIVHLEEDITERKIAEENLEDMRNYTDHLIQTANVMIVSLDDHGRVIHFNPAAESITGYALSYIQGKNWFETLVPRERYAEIHEEFDRLMKGGLPGSFENPIVTQSGEERFISWTNSEIRKRGKIIGIISFGIDITHRKKAEMELRQYQGRLKALASQLTLAEENERRSIAADLHDHVGHALALARMQLNGVLEAQSEVERKMLVKDISHILLKSLQDTRSLIFELSSPTLNEIGLSAAILEWLEERIEKRYGLKTAFVDDIDEKLRKTLDDSMRAVLFRNVRELLTNVIKHAKAGNVSVHLKSENRWVNVIVEDDGVGFDPQASPPEGEEKGGYGLFSIRERMADMGGSFDIQSEPGKGCRAVLMAPVRERSC